MMAANYRHIGGGVNRLGRHYSRFSGFWPMASVVDQSLALRKSQNRESNRRRRANRLDEGQRALEAALRIAHGQQAKAYELRAATSLAPLWGEQGRRAEAHDLLAPVYGWFTEGFATADLRQAKAVLDELA